MDKQHSFTYVKWFIGLGILTFLPLVGASELTLRIPETALNESISALTDANALGLSGWDSQWGVNKWWFQIDNASINLIEGGNVNISATANAQGNINIADVISFSSSGNGSATLNGGLTLNEATNSRRLLQYEINNISGVSVNISNFPNFANSFLTDVIESYFTIFGPIKFNPGISILPTIPENAILSSIPHMEITDNELFVTITPKRVLPDLKIINMTYTKLGQGYVYSFNVGITNTGDATAQRNFKVALFDGDPQITGTSMLGSTKVIGTLEKGASTTIIWQAALTNGIDHNIFVVVDSDNTVLEYHEDNNVFDVKVLSQRGDLDGNLCVDHLDLNILLSAIRGGTKDLSFDLNGDSSVNIADARRLVTYFKNPNGSACL